MIILIITQLILTTSFFFIMTNHPLTLRFILIVIRILYGVTLCLFNLSSWLSYILIIVFLRGIIVIIIYITSLSSNDPLKIRFKLIIFITPLTTAVTGYIFINKNQTYINIKNIRTLNNSLINHSLNIVYKTYNINWKITLLLILYLLIVLIVAVKITSLNKGPLRTKK